MKKKFLYSSKTGIWKFQQNIPRLPTPKFMMCDGLRVNWRGNLGKFHIYPFGTLNGKNEYNNVIATYLPAEIVL